MAVIVGQTCWIIIVSDEEKTCRNIILSTNVCVDNIDRTGCLSHLRYIEVMKIKWKQRVTEIKGFS